MKNYKTLSALSLYFAFLLIGHQGPVSAYAHEYQPLVMLVPGVATEQPAIASVVPSDQPQVLGASTADEQSILFYNPVNKVYESTPSNLNEKEVSTLYSCISRQGAFDIAQFENCYKNIYPRSVVQDQPHTHKKLAVKIVNKEDQTDQILKMRKFHPRTA